MKKRLFSLTLCLCLVLSFAAALSVPVSAAAPYTVYVNNKLLSTTPVSVNGGTAYLTYSAPDKSLAVYLSDVAIGSSYTYDRQYGIFIRGEVDSVDLILSGENLCESNFYLDLYGNSGTGYDGTVRICSATATPASLTVNGDFCIHAGTVILDDCVLEVTARNSMLRSAITMDAMCFQVGDPNNPYSYRTELKVDTYRPVALWNNNRLEILDGIVSLKGRDVGCVSSGALTCLNVRGGDSEFEGGKAGILLRKYTNSTYPVGLARQGWCEVNGLKPASYHPVWDDKDPWSQFIYHTWLKAGKTSFTVTGTIGEEDFKVTNVATRVRIGYMADHSGHNDYILCPSASFRDAPSFKSWAHDAIDFVVSEGYMTGTDATHFSPKVPMSRAMLVTVLYRLAGSPDVFQPSSFTDVKQGSWYDIPVAWAANCGIVQGDTSGKFNPNGSVTREDTAAMLYRFAKVYSLDTKVSGSLSGFPDADRVHSYAVTAMKWAVGKGFITGNNVNGTAYLDPRSSTTRDQMAAILTRFIKYYNL